MAKKPKKSDKTEELQPVTSQPELQAAPEPAIEEPLETPAEAVAAEVVAAEIVDAAEAELTDEEAETEAEAEDGLEPESEEDSDDSGEDDPEFVPKPRPPAKLERLQKILAAAGVASRRSAEGMIEQGRVQVNGKVVTELGTKADAGRDHIRVDGKLLQGAERLRYFVLNKPKGFVTTVKDPEGRPTVMQFFDKMKERLYPVGRLDYMSEGLLLVTNDGELANRLTKASSGVEKTYLVKVAGQPSEAELDILRGGVSIERGKPGEGRVKTSPARIRQVRQGDNPWYEVVLIEGRNRELRKMFEEVGHFVEKIRRVGYGPLVLDQEPGNLRELEPQELEALRLTAEGKLRTPKAKELRRRNLLDSQLPTLQPKPSRLRPPVRPPAARPVDERSASTERPAEYRPKRAFGQDKPFRPADRGPASSEDRPRRAPGAGPAKFGSARPAGRPAAGPAKRPFRPEAGEGSFAPPPTRPAWKKDDRPARPPARFAPGASGEDRPRPERPSPDSSSSFRPRPGSPGAGRTGGGRSFGAKPAWNKPSGGSDRPAYQRPAPPRRENPAFDDDLGPVRPPNLHIEEVQGPDRSSYSRPPSIRSSAPRTGSPRSYSERPSSPRPERPSGDRPSFDRPSSDRPSGAKPFRAEGGLSRPYTTSSGKPRAGGARPSSKPAGRSYDSKSAGYKRPSSGTSGGPAKRPFRREEGEGSYTPRPPAGSGARPSRPYTPRTEGASDYRPTKAKPYPSSSTRSERSTDTGWKPKTRYGGSGKPAGGPGSKPGGFSKPGGPARSGYKARPSGSGPKRTGPRPGGKRPGPPGGGKKRG